MKINFDKLMVEKAPISLDSSIINLGSQPSRSAKRTTYNSSIQTQDVTPMTHRNRRADDEESIERVLELKLALAMQQELQTVPKVTPVIQRKKTKKVDIAELINKMHCNLPCSKKGCKELRVQKERKDKQQTCPLNTTIPSRNNTSRQSEQNQSIHERLYFEAKMNQQGLYQLSKQYDQTRKEELERSKEKRTKKYLQNYVPFYDRLEYEVRKSQEKYKIYKRCPELIEGSTKKYFTPTLISKKYQDVQSRYSQVPSCRGQFSYRDDYASSLNTSLMSVMSLDKSVQMVSNIQEFFFKKMKFIFTNHEQQYVCITSDQIELLSDTQFNVMQGFIRQIEEAKIETDEFQRYLRDYYNNLGFRDKQELRNHLRQAKKLHRKNTNKPKSMAQSCIRVKPQPKHSRPSRYYSKLQNFV